MTEDQLEQETLDWLASVGYTPLNARDLDNLDPRLERTSTATKIDDRVITNRNLKSLHPAHGDQ